MTILFSECKVASNNPQQADQLVIIPDDHHREIRHWAMPSYRQMGAINVQNEIRKPTYNRLSNEKNREILQLMHSIGSKGPRTSIMTSIWHSYTRYLI